MRIWPWLCFLILSSMLARAQLLPGDNEAKTGDYPRAEALYRQAEQGADAATRRRLLCRRLAVAQATNDVVEAKKLAAELDQLLSGLDDPAVALRLHLLRGAIAYRTRDLTGAQAAFARARPLAQKLGEAGDPIGGLGMYECLSYEFLSKVAREGRPTTGEYEAAVQRAFQASQRVPMAPGRSLWALDIYRSILWTRHWIWQAWEYSYLDSKKKDLAGANAWGAVSLGIGQNAYQLNSAAAGALRDPEFTTAGIHAGLEITEGFPLVPAIPLLLEQMKPGFASLADNVETRFMQGRYARSWARTYFFALNDRAAALREYLKAADWFARGGQRIDQMDVYVELAYMYTLENAPADWEGEVARRLEELLKLTQQYSYPNGRYFGLGFQGVLKARQGQLPEAEGLLRQSLAQVSQWSRETAQSPTARSQTLQRPEVRLFSDTLIEVLLKQNRQAEALEASQGLKAEAESAGIDLNRIVPKDQASAQDLKQLEKTRLRGGQLRAELQAAQMQGDSSAVQQLEGQLASNKAEFEKTVNRLRQRDPEFEKLLSVRPSSFAKLQSQLSPEVVVVEYYTSADKLVIFAATRSQLQIYSVPLTREQLLAKVRGLRSKLVSRQNDPQLSGELYNALIAPLEPMLDEQKVLAVIPSGYLYYLPFAALQKPGGGYLNEKVSVCLLTATELPDIGNFRSAGKPASLLALANPDGSLPGATREVEQLGRLFSQKTTYLGDQATKDKVTGQSQVLHVATHGILDPRDLNDSYLALAGRNGRLTAGEIYGLDLKKVSLVTLSACETALGESNPGSEVATLAQAFSFAGSRSIMASLWQVEDESTARLMVEFYTQLLAGKSKAESLRLAQLSVMKQPQWSAPYYWAPFELIGDWH